MPAALENAPLQRTGALQYSATPVPQKQSHAAMVTRQIPIRRKVIRKTDGSQMSAPTPSLPRTKAAANHLI